MVTIGISNKQSRHPRLATRPPLSCWWKYTWLQPFCTLFGNTYKCWLGKCLMTQLLYTLVNAWQKCIQVFTKDSHANVQGSAMYNPKLETSRVPISWRVDKLWCSHTIEQWNTIHQWKWTKFCYRQQRGWFSQTELRKEARHKRIHTTYVFSTEGTEKWTLSFLPCVQLLLHLYRGFSLCHRNFP